MVPVWPNGWVFVYQLSDSGFESSCSRLNFRFRACFEQRVPWHSGNYRVWIHSETRTLHDKNIQSLMIFILIWWMIWNKSNISWYFKGLSLMMFGTKDLFLNYANMVFLGDLADVFFDRLFNQWETKSSFRWTIFIMNRY